MGAPLRLVIFDVDGTLVDSQADIVASMTLAFEAIGVPVPAREAILSGVGLSLDVLMPRLAPHLSGVQHSALVQGYKDAYMTQRRQHGAAVSSPLYPGALECLRSLHAIPEVLLGVATGKSKRGLDKLIEGHGLEGLFVTQQVADFHPSKPHPAMILAALSETGVAAKDALMIGDTSFDMQMAADAGVGTIGVTWGYHDRAALNGATHLAERFEDVVKIIKQTWSITP